MLTCSISAVQWLEQYEQAITAAAAEAAVVMSGRKSEQAPNRGPFAIGDSAEQGTGNAVEQGGIIATSEAAEAAENEAAGQVSADAAAEAAAVEAAEVAEDEATRAAAAEVAEDEATRAAALEAAEAAAYVAAENEATEAAAAQTWHDEWEEEDDAMVIDTLRALRRLDLSMLSTRSEHRDCEAAATEVKAAAEVETTAAEDKAAAADSGTAAADSETAAADSEAAAADSETAATINEAAIVNGATAINGEQKALAFASRFRCLASIRKEDEPPDWRSVQRGNAAAWGSSSRLQGRTSSRSQDGSSSSMLILQVLFEVKIYMMVFLQR